MNCYVINLPRSTERLEHMRAQLDRFELVEAIDGSTLDRDDPRIDWATVDRFPGWLTPTMLGCSLSHLEVARQIVESGRDRAVVLEDDVISPAGFAELAAAVADALRGAEVGLLYYRAWGHAAMTTGARAGGVELRVPLKPRVLVCSGGYVTTRDAAQRMLDKLYPITLGPDSWGAFLERGVLDRVLCAYPRPLSVRHDFRSTLGLSPRWAALVPNRLRARRRARIEQRMSQF